MFIKKKILSGLQSYYFGIRHTKTIIFNSINTNHVFYLSFPSLCSHISVKEVLDDQIRTIKKRFRLFFIPIKNVKNFYAVETCRTIDRFSYTFTGVTSRELDCAWVFLYTVQCKNYYLTKKSCV